MSYSIFSETMADMTYQQIEKAAERKVPILFPIAVIEEHGPHLCLGTDTYIIYNLCKKIRKGPRPEGHSQNLARRLIIARTNWSHNPKFEARNSKQKSSY